MSIFYVEKQVAEKTDECAIDFKDRIPAGDAIASHTVTVTDKNGADTTLAMKVSSNVIGTVVTAVIQAGTNYFWYTVAFQVTTTNGLIKKDEIRLLVKNRTGAL